MKVRSTEFRLTAIAVVGVVVIGFLGWRQMLAVDDESCMATGMPFSDAKLGAIPERGLADWKNVGVANTAMPIALAALRRMVDQSLVSEGDKTIAALTQRINAEIDRTLEPSNVPQAKHIVGLYLEYKRELIDVERRHSNAGQGVQAARNHLLAIQALRSRYFTAEESQAMFGFDDANDMDAIARAEIDQDPSLTAEQRQKRLSALDAAMPAILLRQRQEQPAVLQVEEKVYAMRTQGGSDDDVYRLRAKEVDPQAAARLAASDREEAQWTRRIAQYLTERNQILEAPETAADPDHKAALLNLQRTRFTEDERSRLSVYEQ